MNLGFVLIGVFNIHEMDLLQYVTYFTQCILLKRWALRR